MTASPEGSNGGAIPGVVSKKNSQRLKCLTGSLETLISQMAVDWEQATTIAPGTSTLGTGKGKGGKGDMVVLDKSVYGQVKKGQLLFSELHATSRKTHSAIETCRNKAAASKQSMDLNHLQLQNLLYERDHLSRETQLCKDFSMKELSKLEDAEEQGFLEDVDTLQTIEEHARNLAILKDQKDKRINAQRELAEVQIRVKAANSAVGESNQFLKKLPEYLKNVEKALVPLRKNMPWRPGVRRGRDDEAAELPGPLFTLYCQLEAYCDSLVSDEVAVEDERAAPSSLVAEYDAGGGKETPTPLASVALSPAKAYVSASTKAAAEGSCDLSEPSRANGRASPSPGHDGAVVKRLKRHHRQEDEEDNSSKAADGSIVSGKKARVSRREAGKVMLDVLKPSPTEVVLTLSCIKNAHGAGDGGTHSSKSKGKSAIVSQSKNAGAEDSFTLRFCYLPALGIVAVTPPSSSTLPPSVLVNLFPNDTGRNTPNPTNHHSRAAKFCSSGVFEFPVDLPCRPFRWAQWLAGLHFPPMASADGQGSAAAGRPRAIEPSTRAVVAELRSRVRTQWALAAQLKSIGEKGPVCLVGFQDRLPPGRATANNVELRSWKELTGSDVEQAASSFRSVSTQGSADNDASSTDTAGARNEWERYGARYFRGVVKMKRGQKKEADVEMLVEVPTEYPVRPSRVKLAATKAKTVPLDDTGLQDLRAIANEVNAHSDALLTEDVACWDHLLSHQLFLTMSCLATPSVDGFTGRLRRGRMRRKPVLFDRLQKTFVHR